MIDERGGIEPGLPAILGGVVAVRAEIRRLLKGHIVAADKLEELIESVNYLGLSVREAMAVEQRKARR